MTTAPYVRLDAIYPKPQAQASGKNLHADVRARHALGAWMRAKEHLARVMVREDFQSFVRPMYLLAVLSGHHFLVALPANRRVVERARNFRPNLVAAISQQGYSFAGFAPYPSDADLEALSGIPAFTPYIEIVSRGRVRKISSRLDAENARDASDLRAALEAR